MNASAGQIIGNRYQLQEKLGEGGMGAVYLALDRLNRHEVALKRVSTGADQLDPSTQGGDSISVMRVALAHEFQTLASLRHPHVISVLDYGFDDERIPYFTMNYLTGTKNIVAASRRKGIPNKLKLVLEMLQALAYVHRRGIIHHDLKPDNALVTAEGQVKVLDFGLATLSGHQPDEETISGTLAYMAPEILLGAPVGPSADLYAVGMIACEIFGGSHPFPAESAGQLINRIISQPVDVSHFDIPYALAMVLTRLLDKRPDNRYQDANETIRAFCEALDQPIPQESIAIRESFLQAAKFVGRESELDQLSLALGRAIDGIGSAWLIGGESGAGKSRLVEELGVRALVKGALVLHGQGVLEGEQAYELWRDPLRRLALATDLNDTEAGILQTWLSDLGVLLERSIPTPPALEGRAGQQRMLDVIEAVFRRQPKAILLILEDLQWSIENLDVLKMLTEIATERPLLIVATYRDDEAPDLPEQLPGATALRLGRLDDDGIEQLSVSMLGDAGSNSEVLQLLRKETEGNVFFLVEVVRALAEQAGRLSLVGEMTLPTEIIAGGVQNVIRRRLDHIPESARALLRLAAVAGRQLDLNLLASVQDQNSLEDWLTECSNAAVLEVIDGQWRFSHDKLRTGLLAMLEDSEHGALHRQIAATLETVYAAAPDEYAALISEHYEDGGEKGKAAHWYLRAAKHAQKTYAPSAAVDFYHKALELGQNAPEGVSLEQQIDIYQSLGEMLTWQAQFNEATQAFETAREKAHTAGNLAAEGIAYYGMADTLLSQHELQAALESAMQAESLAEKAGARLEHARALWIKGWTLFELGEMEEALALGEKLLALSDELENQKLQADSLNLVGVVNMLVGKFIPATEQFERALKIYQEIGNRVSAMSLVNNLGAIAFERGDYRQAAARYQEALDGARELRHRDTEMEFLRNLGGALVHAGDIAGGRNLLLEVIDFAETTGAEEAATTYLHLAESFLAEHRDGPALKAAQRALELAQEYQSQEDLASAWRVLGQTAALLKTVIFTDDDEPHDAKNCFEESIRIATETGMKGEQARTLRAWGLHEIQDGNAEVGRQLWQDARAIFEDIGANFEVEQMAALNPGR